LISCPSVIQRDCSLNFNWPPLPVIRVFAKNWFFYDPSWILKLFVFIWTLRSSEWVVFTNFLLKDATDRSKISSDQKCLFFTVSLSFFANTPFKVMHAKLTTAVPHEDILSCKKEEKLPSFCFNISASIFHRETAIKTNKFSDEIFLISSSFLFG